MAGHDRRARRDPGSDTAGVVGVTSRAIDTLAATCKLRVPLPDSCTDAGENAGAGAN
jgi:hypothetical protein